MSILDDLKASLSRAGTEATQQADLYSQYVGGENEVSTQVQNKLKEQYGYNKDVLGEENKLQEEMQTNYVNPNFSPDQFAGDIYAAGQAYVQRQASIQGRLETLRGVREQRSGTIADIVNSLVGAYKGKTERIGAQADAAKVKHGMAESAYDREYGAEQDRIKREEDKRQFDESMELNYAQLAKSGSGSGKASQFEVEADARSEAMSDISAYIAGNKWKSEFDTEKSFLPSLYQAYPELKPEELQKLTYELRRPYEG